MQKYLTAETEKDAIGRKNDENRNMEIEIHLPQESLSLTGCYSGFYDGLATKSGGYGEERSFSFNTGRYYEFFFHGIHFSHTAVNCSGCRKLLRCPCPMVQMIFTLKSDCYYSGTAADFSPVEENHHNLLFFQPDTYSLNFETDKEIEVFEIGLTADFFSRFMPSDETDPLFFKSEGREYFSNIPVTPEMKTLLYDVANCKRQGRVKRLFAEAKIVELLMLRFEQYELLLNAEPEDSFKKIEIEKMYEARDIILSNPGTPCSLIDLAHRVGTNEFNLKKGFKRVFGTTVYKYWHNIRMERAKDLIVQGNRNISEIAYLVGYQHATHFTAAFKKHFGYIPKNLKS